MHPSQQQLWFEVSALQRSAEQSLDTIAHALTAHAPEAFVAVLLLVGVALVGLD